MSALAPKAVKPKDGYELEQVLVCVVCGITSFRKRWLKKYGMKYSRCRRCGLVWTNPRLSNKKYMERVEELGEQRLAVSLDKLNADVKGLEGRVELIENFTPGRDLLDVGSGDGTYVKSAVDRGFNAVGVEISATAAEFAAATFKIEIIRGDFVTLEIPPESRDVVTMWDVLEHLPNPMPALEKAVRVLRPGGHLFILTPNTKGISSRLRGRRWWVYGPGDHMNMFEPETVRRALTSVGLEVVVIKTQDLCVWDPPERAGRPSLISRWWPVGYGKELDEETSRRLMERNLGDWIIGVGRKP